jgi:hypothetical protein
MQIQRTAVQTYLKQVLGIPVPLVQPWDGEAKLPYFLANTFQICQMDLLGNSVLLAFSRDSEKHSLADVRAQLDKVRAIAGQPSFFV